jgi:hypothetical protein
VVRGKPSVLLASFHALTWSVDISNARSVYFMEAWKEHDERMVMYCYYKRVGIPRAHDVEAFRLVAKNTDNDIGVATDDVYEYKKHHRIYHFNA